MTRHSRSELVLCQYENAQAPVARGLNVDFGTYTGAPRSIATGPPVAPTLPLFRCSFSTIIQAWSILGALMFPSLVIFPAIIRKRFLPLFSVSLFYRLLCMMAVRVLVLSFWHAIIGTLGVWRSVPTRIFIIQYGIYVIIFSSYDF